MKVFRNRIFTYSLSLASRKVAIADKVWFIKTRRRKTASAECSGVLFVFKNLQI